MMLIIEATERKEILTQLQDQGMGPAHFTNGTYAYPAEMTVPTTLAGFRFQVDREPSLPLVVAVNSDKSMRLNGLPDKESQMSRALKVAVPLAEAFPDHQVIVLFYDEETPYELYEALHEQGYTHTLHKWGYGTKPNESKIVGAGFFNLVFGHPLPNDMKPKCAHITPLSEKPQNIIVEDLRGQLIAVDGVLFSLPKGLKKYQSSALHEEKISLLTDVKLVDVVALSQERCPVPIKAKLKYATEKNFVGRRVEGYEKGTDNFALMTRRAAEQLCAVQNDLLTTYGYGLLVYDAYRPKRSVHDFMMWSRQPATSSYELARKEKHYPCIEKGELFKLGYVAEDSGHCYGNTVDLVLINPKTGEKLPMGARFDFMDEKAHYSAGESDIGEEAYSNRQILREAMQKFGFHPYEMEYWHFSHGGNEGREVSEPIDVEITENWRRSGLR